MSTNTPSTSPAAANEAATNSESRTWNELLREAPSFLISMVVHLLGILLLMAVYIPIHNKQVQNLVSAPVDLEDAPTFDDVFADDPDPIPLNLDPAEEVTPFETNTPINDVMVGSFNDPNSDTLQTVSATPSALAPSSVSFGAPGSVTQLGSLNTNGLSGRGTKSGLTRGGSEGSERAVALALKWLAQHQLPNGSWSYNLGRCPSCNGQCKDSGSCTSSNSATALALLPFLGAGITDRGDVGKKEYQAVVRKGLLFLVNNVKRERDGLSFIDDSTYGMYHHGLCTIVICEASAMTRDKKYYTIASGAIKFIENAQDPIGGGWRYQPRQAGDTSVVGWQWMALKSADMGYNIPLNPLTTKRAISFLDNVVGYDGGAGYGYDNNSRRGTPSKATTAIGLLCRMYSGWTPDTPPLQRGVKELSSYGPDLNNLYYSYYATQVMHHYGGDDWEKWNKVMRDSLINAQAKEGHETGSWFASGGHAENGGRLYTTSMSTMILEVYYRHMPLFKKMSFTESIPLEDAEKSTDTNTDTGADKKETKVPDEKKAEPEEEKAEKE